MKQSCFLELKYHKIGTKEGILQERKLCSAKKHDKNGHLLGFVPHTCFSLFDLFINIFILFRSTLLYE